MSQFTEKERSAILHLKSAIASYYNLSMKKLGNPALESLFFNDCIITGGCLSALWHGDKVNDIDLYAKDEKAMNKIKAVLTNESNNSIVKVASAYSLDTEDGPSLTGQPLITANAVTLANDVQFVYLGAAEDCRKQFDFIHCMPWYDLRTQKLHISKAQVDSIQTKTLVPNISGEKIKERRIKKYTDKGWSSYLSAVNPVEFTWNGDPYTIGVIAEEIAKTLPEVYINSWSEYNKP